MDKIILKGMEFYAYHGVMKEEQRLGQRFIVDITMILSLQEAGETEVLSKTVNYAEVYELYCNDKFSTTYRTFSMVD